MGCHFCKEDHWDVHTDESCDYCICWECWASLPKWLPNKEQAWKLIQLRGDKICTK